MSTTHRNVSVTGSLLLVGQSQTCCLFVDDQSSVLTAGFVCNSTLINLGTFDLLELDRGHLATLRWRHYNFCNMYKTHLMLSAEPWRFRQHIFNV